MKNYVIYTDGALSQTTKNGGIGFLILNEKEKFVGSYSKHFPNTTSQRMEVISVIYALAAIKNRSNITIYSDSAYVVNGVNNKTKKNVNREIWYNLLLLNKKHNVTYKWIKGHTYLYNKLCDHYATFMSKDC